jgi:hypothetical protein
MNPQPSIEDLREAVAAAEFSAERAAEALFAAEAKAQADADAAADAKSPEVLLSAQKQTLTQESLRLMLLPMPEQGEIDRLAAIQCQLKAIDYALSALSGPAAPALVNTAPVDTKEASFRHFRMPNLRIPDDQKYVSGEDMDAFLRRVVKKAADCGVPASHQSIVLSNFIDQAQYDALSQHVVELLGQDVARNWDDFVVAFKALVSPLRDFDAVGEKVAAIRVFNALEMKMEETCQNYYLRFRRAAEKAEKDISVGEHVRKFVDSLLPRISRVVKGKSWYRQKYNHDFNKVLATAVAADEHQVESMCAVPRCAHPFGHLTEDHPRSRRSLPERSTGRSQPSGRGSTGTRSSTSGRMSARSSSSSASSASSSSVPAPAPMLSLSLDSKKHCLLCDKDGHTKSRCPLTECFNCHQMGHISSQCRKPKVARVPHQDAPSINMIWRETDAMVHGAAVGCIPTPFHFSLNDVADSKNHESSPYSCPSRDNGGSISVVTPAEQLDDVGGSFVKGVFRINGVKMTGLIDSGASCSLIDPSVVEALGLEVIPQTGTLNSFSPSMTSERIGSVVVELKHADNTLTSVTLEVHPNIHEFICGCDVMGQLGIGLYGVSTKDPGFDEEIDRARILEHGKNALCTGRQIGDDVWLDEDRASDADLKIIESGVASALAENLLILDGSFCTDPAAVVPLDTGDAAPIHRYQYPVSDVYKKDISAQVEKWFDEGIVVKAPPDSRYNSPLLPVRKRDDQGNFTKCRVCIDPRPLNEKLADFAHAVPKISELFGRLKGFKLASSLDLKSSYNQFPLAECDRVKTTFTWQCKAGRRFMFAGAPFGIKPLTQRFQSVMEKILESVSGFALVYVDDIIVFSDGSAEDHATKTAAVLGLLTRSNLRVNPDKCHFGFTRLRFLGHLVSGSERTPDPRKLLQLHKFSRPTTGKQVMAYLGFVNYLREYVPLYSEVAAPLECLRKLKKIRG